MSALPFDDVGNTQLVRGAFQFDAGALKDARAVVVNEARVISGDFKKVGTAATSAETSVKQASGGIAGALNQIANRFRAAKAEAEAFAKTDLGTIRDWLRNISQQWAAASAAAGVFIGLGLRSADAINNIKIRFIGMLGTQEKAEALMGEIGERARELGQPMRAAQEAAAALLPQLEGNTDQLKVYIGLASRLSAINPNEGLAGASFAIREAVSSGGTDLVSLAERFNISKKALRAEIEAAKKSGQDDNTAFATALDKVLNKMGLTEETAQKLAGTLTNQVKVAMEELNLAAGEALAPLATDLVPIISGFAKFVGDLRQTNPELLKMAAAGALIVASISPLSFALSKIVAGYAAVKGAAIAAGVAIKANSTLLSGSSASFANAGLGAKIGVTGAALTAGVVLGGQVTTGLANAGVQGGDFDRIRAGEDALAIAGERFKQVIVILAAALVEVGRIIAKAGAFIFNAFDQVVNALKLGSSFIKEGFLRITEAFGNAVAAIGDLLARIPGQENNGLRDGGARIAMEANQQLADLLLTERPALLERLKQGFALPEETETAIDNTFDSLGKSVVQGLNNFFFPVQEAAEKVEEGLRDLGGSLGDAAPTFSDDMVDAFADYQDELGAIQEQAQADRLQEAANYEKELATKTQEQYTAQLKAIEKFNQDAATEQTKFGWKLDDLRKEFNGKEAEEEKKFRQEEKKRRRDHRTSLLQAAAALDGRAVYLQLRKFREETKSRKDEAEAQKRARQSQLESRIAQMQMEFDREQAFKSQQFYSQELPLLQQQQGEELMKLAEAHQAKLAQIDAAAQSEKQKVTAAFVETFNELVNAEGNHQNLMLQTQRAGQEMMRAELAAWWSANAGIVARTAPGVTPAYRSASTYSPSSQYPSLVPPPAPLGSASGQMPVQFLSGTSGFVRGGNVRLDPGEGVINKGTMQMLRRMMGGQPSQQRLAMAMAGGGAGGGRSGKQISIGSITVPVSVVNGGSGGGIDARDFERKLRPVVEKIFEDLAE